jgi:DNA primase
MARIPEQEIERLKREVSLQRLVEAAGIELKKHGKDYLGLCPFHDDHEPSLVVSPDKNLWHCLGACGEGGDVIAWTMKRERVSFRHAAELLQRDYPSLAAKEETWSIPATPVLTETFERQADDQALLNQVIDFYHETLLQSPEALAYLDKRGLNDPELIARFKLGFANRTLAYRLPEKSRKAGAELRGQLQEIGILRQSGHEHFNGSLVVPVLDGEGNATEVYGRKITPNLRKGTPHHLYLPGPHVGVWNREGLTGQTEVILCEALIDAMSFWVAGYRNVTAAYGTEGFTADHLAAFKEVGIERVLIAYDRDEAGNSAAAKLAKRLQGEGLACYRLHFPKGMDANDYALNVQPASKSLGVVIRSAEYMGDGLPPERQLDIEMQTGQSVEVVSEEADLPPSLAADPQPEAPAPAPEPAAPESETPALPAAAIPPAPENQVQPDVTDHEVNIEYGNRHYRVRGLQKNSSYEVMKVNVLAKIGDVIHVDTFDLYSAKHRQAFARVAAAECGIEDKLIQRDLGQLLLQLEGLQDKAIQAALQPKEPTGYTMEESEREQALALLRDPKLTERIAEAFAQTGLVGEPANALMGYLAAVSRKLKTPLAIIVQSTSAAGKSALMDAVLRLVPEEDRVHYSAMTGQSLFYLGESDLKHKILGIAEEEGVRQAAYALKLLQSQGELTIASTGKDPESGKLVTEEYRVEGPVMLFLTTTAIDIDEELLNRCVVLTINESREQTAAIQQRQRQARTLQGLLASNQAEQIIQQHQNAQRLLRPLAVVNPYAEQLAFADSRTRTRRDHEKYLTLIDSIALLYQYQREVKRVQQGDQAIEYIEVTREDIALANRLAHDILGRSLDELPPPTRQLLKHLHDLVADKMKAEGLRQNEVRFTRREAREAAGLSNSQVSIHLDRLVALEYLYAHHGRNGQRYVYELVFDGEPDSEQPQLIGLIDVAQLADRAAGEAMMENLPVSDDDLPPSFRPASGDLPDSFHTPQNSDQPSNNKAAAESAEPKPKNARSRTRKNTASHRSPSISLAASAEA